MEKKYQVFVSSTYTDLIEEREAVYKGMLLADYIPTGMEVFTSSDVESFEAIKKAIDICDYLVVIIGYRYGSVHLQTGKSFTEMEYDYAIERKIPVLAFIKQDGLETKQANIERDPESYDKLKSFKERLREKVVQPWDTKDKLAHLITRSLDAQVKADAGLNKGWIKNDNLEESIPILKSLNSLGISYIRTGSPTKRDDDEKIRLFRSSQEIKIIQYNGSNFFAFLKPYITEFLSRSNTKLKVLLASKDSEFYEENSKMVSEELSHHDENKNLVGFAEARLRTNLSDATKINPEISHETEKLQVKHFNTQLRLPMVIFDDAVCHVTITLAPAESIQAFEMEFGSSYAVAGYAEVCVRHFDRIWETT